MSGSSGRVTTGLACAAGAAAPSRLSSAVAPSRERRCASSFAFSAFLSASSSRLMSIARVLSRKQGRRDALGIGFAKKVFSRHLPAETAEIALEARVADHGRAQEDHQLGLGREIGPVGEQLADEGN